MKVNSLQNSDKKHTNINNDSFSKKRSLVKYHTGKLIQTKERVGKSVNFDSMTKEEFKKSIQLKLLDFFIEHDLNYNSKVINPTNLKIKKNKIFDLLEYLEMTYIITGLEDLKNFLDYYILIKTNNPSSQNYNNEEEEEEKDNLEYKICFILFDKLIDNEIPFNLNDLKDGKEEKNENIKDENLKISNFVNNISQHTNINNIAKVQDDIDSLLKAMFTNINNYTSEISVIKDLISFLAYAVSNQLSNDYEKLYKENYEKFEDEKTIKDSIKSNLNQIDAKMRELNEKFKSFRDVNYDNEKEVNFLTEKFRMYENETKNLITTLSFYEESFLSSKKELKQGHLLVNENKEDKDKDLEGFQQLNFQVYENTKLKEEFQAYFVASEKKIGELKNLINNYEERVDDLKNKLDENRYEIQNKDNTINDLNSQLQQWIDSINKPDEIFRNDISNSNNLNITSSPQFPSKQKSFTSINLIKSSDSDEKLQNYTFVEVNSKNSKNSYSSDKVKQAINSNENDTNELDNIFNKENSAKTLIFKGAAKKLNLSSSITDNLNNDFKNKFNHKRSQTTLNNIKKITEYSHKNNFLQEQNLLSLRNNIKEKDTHVNNLKSIIEIKNNHIKKIDLQNYKLKTSKEKLELKLNDLEDKLESLSHQLKITRNTMPLYSNPNQRQSAAKVQSTPKVKVEVFDDTFDGPNNNNSFILNTLKKPQQSNLFCSRKVSELSENVCESSDLNIYDNKSSANQNNLNKSIEISPNEDVETPNTANFNLLLDNVEIDDEIDKMKSMTISQTKVKPRSSSHNIGSCKFNSDDKSHAHSIINKLNQDLLLINKKVVSLENICSKSKSKLNTEDEKMYNLNNVNFYNFNINTKKNQENKNNINNINHKAKESSNLFKYLNETKRKISFQSRIGNTNLKGFREKYRELYKKGVFKSHFFLDSVNINIDNYEEYDKLCFNDINLKVENSNLSNLNVKNKKNNFYKTVLEPSNSNTQANNEIEILLKKEEKQKYKKVYFPKYKQQIVESFSLINNTNNTNNNNKTVNFKNTNCSVEPVTSNFDFLNLKSNKFLKRFLKACKENLKLIYTSNICLYERCSSKSKKIILVTASSLYILNHENCFAISKHAIASFKTIFLSTKFPNLVIVRFNDELDLVFEDYRRQDLIKFLNKLYDNRLLYNLDNSYSNSKNNDTNVKDKNIIKPSFAVHLFSSMTLNFKNNKKETLIPTENLFNFTITNFNCSVKFGYLKMLTMKLFGKVFVERFVCLTYLGFLVFEDQSKQPILFIPLAKARVLDAVDKSKPKKRSTNSKNNINTVQNSIDCTSMIDESIMNNNSNYNQFYNNYNLDLFNNDNYAQVQESEQSSSNSSFTSDPKQFNIKSQLYFNSESEKLLFEVIQSNDKSYTFQAHNKEATESWVKAIRKVTSIIN